MPLAEDAATQAVMSHPHMLAQHIFLQRNKAKHLQHTLRWCLASMMRFSEHVSLL